MKTMYCILACGALAIATLGTVHAQSNEMLETEANIGSKMARERAKQNANRGARDEEARRGGENSQCGSVDIGNLDTAGRFNRAREINVFVKGDVINANNRCR